MGTFEGTADQARATGQRVAKDLHEGFGNMKQTAGDEVKNLIADVEDLLARIADLQDVDVARVRGKVMNAVASAKDSLAQRTEGLRRQAQNAAATADDYVRESPWAAVGIAALVGAVAGILATRRN